MKLAFLDLDNTLIDANYRLTVSETRFRNVVQELAEKDVSLGLCSDSAAITLRQWVARLGFNGPLVAERGAVVWDSVRGTDVILDASETSWFRDFRESFIVTTLQNFPTATVVIGDATKFVKGEHLRDWIMQPVFAVNGLRVASFSFFACRLKGDRPQLEPDPESLCHASTLAEEVALTFGKKKSELFWHENPRHGILIVHASITDKRRGVKTLVDQLRPEKTVMVGDEMSDYLNLPDVEQYAVGNADPSYKEKAKFVAGRSFTEGVIDCIRHFA